jgi:hypothetical protein
VSSDQLEQLPASEYSPVEFYTLDWDEMQLAIRIAEIKLEFIKSDFAIIYPPSSILALPSGCS